MMLLSSIKDKDSTAIISRRGFTMEAFLPRRHTSGTSNLNLRIPVVVIGVVLYTMTISFAPVDGMSVQLTPGSVLIPTADDDVATNNDNNNNIRKQNDIIKETDDHLHKDEIAQHKLFQNEDLNLDLDLLTDKLRRETKRELLHDVYRNQRNSTNEGFIGEEEATKHNLSQIQFSANISNETANYDTHNDSIGSSIIVNSNLLYFQSEHHHRPKNTSVEKNNTSIINNSNMDANERILSDLSKHYLDANYLDNNNILDSEISGMEISPLSSQSSSTSSSSSSSLSSLFPSWSWLYSWTLPEVTGSGSRSKRSSGDGENSLTSEYIMVMYVPHLATSSNSSIDATILRLKHALSKEIPWSIRDIHVNELNFAASQIEFYFLDGASKLVPVKLLLSKGLVTRVSSHVPDLALSQLEEDQGNASTIDDESIWEKTYFPWAVAAASVSVILMVVVGVYVCCRRKKVPEEPVDVEDGTVGIVVSHSIHYPTLKPELGEPTPVQPPDLQLGGFTSPPGLTSPVLTQPIRIKGKGLLERRGSNASLTLDLNPCNDTGRWEGTPPKESTALEFLMSAGNRLSRRDLRNAVKNSKALYEEFWEIPMNHTEKVCVAGSGVKNRYKTIIPNEHSRVILPDIDDDPLNSYINANYIRGYEGEPKAYIATQGPMAHTILDFWKMVWFEKCAIIVMITKLKEKSKPKCEDYLPEKSGQFGDIEVVIEKIVVKKGYVVRHITLRAYGESQSILHYWYTAWPDHKPPESPHMLLDLVKEVELRRFQSNGITPRGAVCVHCSAGIGRTGCFVAISVGIRQLREEHSVDALGIVCAMRIDRGGLIQTHEQYDFIHQALAAFEKELGESSVQSITALAADGVTTP